jgi:hypothetical protein
MITCPLCDLKVIDRIIKTPVEVGHASDFICPTKIDIGKNAPFPHYARTQLKYLINGNQVYHYVARVPPFEITWLTTGALTVCQLDPKKGVSKMYDNKTTLFADFVKTCQRFKILVPFI